MDTKQPPPPSAPGPTPILPRDVQTASAPPSYEEVMGINQSSVVQGQPELPPLAYIDIMPKFLNPGDLRNRIAPTFQKFSDIIAGANLWLAANPGLQCWKCETVERKVEKGPQGPLIDLETMKLHQSTYGFNVYVLGLRMWLTKKEENTPVQQLGLLNIVPSTKEIELQRHRYGTMFNSPEMVALHHGMSTQTFTTFEGLTDTIARLNEDLKKNPLPGSILNVETATLKCSGFNASRDPDSASFAELGANNFSLRRHCQILRVFYIKGSPRHEQIHMEEVIPEIIRQSGLVGSAVFQPFTAVLHRAQMWLQAQSGIKVVNIETRDARVLENTFTLETEVLSDSNDDFDGSFWQSKFTKMLRIFYVDQPEVTSYSSTLLTSRLFPPLRIGLKSFETMSQTMMRIVAWLSVTRMPIFGIETLQFPFIDNDNIGINPERSDYYVPKNMGKLWVTAIRVYFPSYYQEPPRELLPPTMDWLTQGEGRGSVSCNIL